MKYQNKILITMCHGIINQNHKHVLQYIRGSFLLHAIAYHTMLKCGFYDWDMLQLLPKIVM
jgi:hypothetical protein